MPENKITVRIAIRRHAVFHLLQLFHGMTLYNMTEVTFQAHIHIGFLRLNRLIKRVLHGTRLAVCDCFGINEIHFLKLFHLTKDRRRIMRKLWLCNQRKLQPSHTALDRIFPLFVCHIKKIRQNLDFYRSSVAVA